MKPIFLILAAWLWLGGIDLVHAHVGDHPSVHDTIARIRQRMEKQLSYAELAAMNLTNALKFLTPEERHILGEGHVTFRVNAPVTVSVIRSVKSEEPFWLRDQEFVRASYKVKVGEDEYDVWQKAFPAGWVGLGINSIGGGGEHYFVALAPQDTGTKLKVKSLYPGQARLDSLATDVKPYVDRDEKLASVPPELQGQTLIRTSRDWRDFGKLLNLFNLTKHPSTNRPDHCILTWSGDPRTTQTIQWRTGTSVPEGVVQYAKASDLSASASDDFPSITAKTERIKTPKVLNDPLIYWHTVTLRRLEPDTRYAYRLRDMAHERWTDWAEFTTAPAEAKSFSFMYMGDAQNGLDAWGKMIQRAYASRPDAAFYIMAGDLVNRGAERDDWDSLFANAAGIYDRRVLVPALGNHECQGGKPRLYLSFFDLPRNGPPTLGPERAYAFNYANALFVVLDSNESPRTQTYWLEKQLARTKAKWKFVVYHHPAYSSAPKRDNKSLRESWGSLFDKYHVDLALQGHDHAYLRTYPMRDGHAVDSPKDGTVYIVSVSGTKFYKQDQRNYTEFGMTNVATYQVLDISVGENQLVYRAYDMEGELRDQLIIEK